MSRVDDGELRQQSGAPGMLVRSRSAMRIVRQSRLIQGSEVARTYQRSSRGLR